MKNLVCNPMTYVVAGVFALLTMFGGAELLAQTTPPSVFLTEVVAMDQSIITSIVTTIGPLVAAALGLGLGVWAARYIFSIVKSMSRG